MQCALNTTIPAYLPMLTPVRKAKSGSARRKARGKINGDVALTYSVPGTFFFFSCQGSLIYLRHSEEIQNDQLLHEPAIDLLAFESHLRLTAQALPGPRTGLSASLLYRIPRNTAGQAITEALAVEF